jgi:hypothetical protein
LLYESLFFCGEDAQLSGLLFLSLEVARAFFTRKATPHPLRRLVEAGIVELARKIASPSTFLAHDRVCHSLAIPFYLSCLSTVSLLFWHFDCLLIKAARFQGGFSFSSTTCFFRRKKNDSQSRSSYRSQGFSLEALKTRVFCYLNWVEVNQQITIELPHFSKQLYDYPFFQMTKNKQ